MKVKIRGNFTLYEQKTVGFFTTSQLLYSLLGLLAGIGAYALLHKIIPLAFSTLLATLVCVFIAALGFLRLGGMKATEVIKRIFKMAMGSYKYKYMTEVDYVREEKARRD